MRKLKKFLRRIFKLALLAGLIIFTSTVLITLLYRWVNPPLTPLMVIRAFERDKSGERYGIHKDWVRLDEISPNMVLAVVASEDNRFLEHNGFDFEAIQKARKLNKKGKKLRGASTISQQTAKNVFLWPSRTYIRKGIEVYFTILIEIMWPKERIMEVYLNVIETGKGIYGAEKAARTYYKKPASRISRSECAYLASILPNPRKWDPRKPTSYLSRRQSKILRVMKNIGQVDFHP